MNRASQKAGSFASLKLKTRCEMCGATDRKKGAAPLEPALDPSGRPKILCRSCRIGSAELLAAPRRIYVESLVAWCRQCKTSPNAAGGSYLIGTALKATRSKRGSAQTSKRGNSSRSNIPIRTTGS